MPEPIMFDCELRSVKSCVDHTYNIVINVPEYNLEQAQKLMGMLGALVKCVVVEDDGTV